MSSDEKSPESTIQTPYSPTLPNELWIKCWTNCEREELEKLSAVCRLFRQICCPLFFRVQKFTAPSLFYVSDEEECQEYTDRLHRFSDFVCSPQTLDKFPPAQMVREWSFHGEIVPGCSEINVKQFEKAYDGARKAFIASLPFYPNLHTLYLSDIHIDNTACATLAKLPLLEVLHLSDCIIYPTEGPLLALKSLKLDSCSRGTSQPSSVEFFSFERLTSLSITGDSSRHDIIRLHSFTSWPSKTILTHLEVTISVDIARLLSLLTISPLMEDLEVQELGIPLDDRVPNVLSADIVPRLKCFKGPAYLGRLLVAGRPVEVVFLNHSRVPRCGNYGSRVYKLEYILSVLQEIVRSTATIRSLGIPRTDPSPRLFVDILLNFPHLQVLDVTIEDALILRPNIGPTPSRSKDSATEPHGVTASVNETDSFISLLNWITSEPGLLPADIEDFSLRQAGLKSTVQHTIRSLNKKEIDAARDILLRDYPSLKDLWLGLEKVKLE